MLLALAGLASWAWWFYRGQNRGNRIGGPMSREKIAWLAFALAAWYVVPAFFWRDRRLSPAIRRLYGVHLGAWAARGVVELVLMYGFKAWKPPYGMAFNFSVFALLSGLRWYLGPALAGATTPEDRNAMRHLNLMQGTLLPETLFAAMFHRARQGRTEDVWFADDSPRYRLINQITLLVDVTVYPILGLSVWRYYRPIDRPTYRRAASAYAASTSD